MPLTPANFSLLILVNYRIAHGRCAVGRLDEFFNHSVKAGLHVIALEGADLLSANVDRSHGALTGARQADADVGLTALAGTVDDAAHDGDFNRRRYTGQDFLYFLGQAD